jgi:transcriptional regulator CtsR
MKTSISKLINVKTPEIQVGSTVFVTRLGYIYTSHIEFAEKVGFPNAVVKNLCLDNRISKKVYKDLKGVVLAKDIHNERQPNTILCVVETEDKFQFIIDIKGLR